MFAGIRGQAPLCAHYLPGCAQIVQSTLLRTLSQRDEALALVDITTANWQILYAKDSWEQQARGHLSHHCCMGMSTTLMTRPRPWPAQHCRILWVQ